MKRQGKDRFFREHPQSPLSPQRHAGFERLNYYPLDSSYRFELTLHEHAEKKMVRVETTHGGERELLRWGEFHFELADEKCTLQAYQTDPDTERLFVPFRDGTSGLETYDKGRYLDLEPEIHRIAEGVWVIDFNEAYNPWCDYSGDFDCPFAPAENWLETPIRAGEKKLAP
jgi:uncharacterized protein (DUF1684 family)